MVHVVVVPAACKSIPVWGLQTDQSFFLNSRSARRIRTHTRVSNPVFLFFELRMEPAMPEMRRTGSRSATASSEHFLPRKQFRSIWRLMRSGTHGALKQSEQVGSQLSYRVLGWWIVDTTSFHLTKMVRCSRRKVLSFIIFNAICNGIWKHGSDGII